MEEFSAQLEINEETQKVYGMIIMRGCITASSIASYLKMDLEKAEQAIDDLKQRQLIKEASGIVPRYIPLPPLTGFTEYLGGYSEKVGGAIKKIKAIEETKTVNYDKITSKATADMSSNLAVQTETLKQKYSEITEKTEQSTKTIQDEIDKVENEITTENSDLATKFSTDVKNNTINIQKTNLKLFNDQGKALEASIEKFPAILDQKFNELILDKKQSLGTLKSSSEQKNHEMLLQFKTETNNMVQSMESAFNDIKNADSELFGTHENDLKSTLQQTNTVLKTLVDSSVKNTSILIDSLKTSLHSILNTNNESFQNQAINSIQGTSTTITTNLQEVEQILAKLKKNITTNTTQLYATAKEELATKLLNLNSKIDEKLNQKSTDLSSRFEIILKQLNTDLTTLQEKYSTDTKSLLENLHTKIEGQNSSIENLAQTSEASFTEFSEKITQEFSTSIQKFKEDYIAQIMKQKTERVGLSIQMEQDLNTQILERTTEIVNMTSMAQDNLTKDIGAISDSFNQDIKATTEEYKGILDGTNTQFQSDFDNFSISFGESLANSTDSSASKVKVTFEGLNAKIKEFLELQKTSIKTSTDTSTADITSKCDSTTSQLSENSTLKIEENNTKLSQIEGTLIEKIRSSKDTNNTQFTSLSENIKNITSGYISTLTASIERLTSQINEQVTSQMTSYDNTKEEGIKLLKDQYSQYQGEISSSFAKLKESLDAFSTKNIEELSTKISSSSTKFITDIKAITAKVTGTLDLTKGETLGIFKEMESSINQAVDEIKSSAKESIAIGKKVLEVELGSVFENALTTMDSVKNLGDQPIQVLSKAWDQMLNIDAKKAEKTWHLVGRDAVMPYVHSMINQAKGKMTIVVPDLNDIPLDVILEKRTRFTIITNLGSGLTDGRVDKLKEKGVTVMDYAGKDFIAVDRDNEELLFAAVDEKVDPITAIISELDPMITIMGSMIADYWRRVAKKV